MGVGRQAADNKVSKEEVFGDTLLSGILAGFVCGNYRCSTCKYLEKWGVIDKYNLILWLFYVYFCIQNKKSQATRDDNE